MKLYFKYPLLLTIAFLMSLSIVSCSDKDDDEPIKIWDYYPIEMMVRVSDANGNDLLAPDKENPLLSTIYISYDGEDYQLDAANEPQKAPSRYIMPSWLGCNLVYNKVLSAYCVAIGEWDAFDSDGMVDFYVGDRHHVLSFTNEVIPVNNKGEYNFTRKYYQDFTLVSEGGSVGVYDIVIR